jgi:hypothetical protein
MMVRRTQPNNIKRPAVIGVVCLNLRTAANKTGDEFYFTALNRPP